MDDVPSDERLQAKWAGELRNQGFFFFPRLHVHVCVYGANQPTNQPTDQPTNGVLRSDYGVHGLADALLPRVPTSGTKRLLCEPAQAPGGPWLPHVKGDRHVLLWHVPGTNGSNGSNGRTDGRENSWIFEHRQHASVTRTPYHRRPSSYCDTSRKADLFHGTFAPILVLRRAQESTSAGVGTRVKFQRDRVGAARGEK